MNATPPVVPVLRQVRASSLGGPDVVTVVDVPLPEPGAGEVRIAVEAGTVSFTDTLIRSGNYPDVWQPAPRALGYDVVGRIDAIGPGVVGWQVGDRVADLVVMGGNGTHLVRPAAGLVRAPDAVDAAEAAALVLSGTTAYQLLHRAAEVRAGDRVLIVGALGAVGRLQVQLAHHAGATVYGLGRARQHAGIAALGAVPLDAEDPSWVQTLRETTGGGVDWVFDGIGADGFRRSRAALRPGGTLVAIGFTELIRRRAWPLAYAWALLRLVVLWNLWPDGRRSTFFSITRLRKQQPGWFRDDLAALLDLLAAGVLDVEVTRLSQDDVAGVHARWDAGGVEGWQVVVHPGPAGGALPSEGP